MNDFNVELSVRNERLSGNGLAKCSFLHYEKGYSAKVHSHDFPQLWYCSGGEYVHIINGDEYICKDGFLVIVPPRFEHVFKVPDECGVDLFMLNLSHRMLSELISKNAMHCACLLYSFGFEYKKDAEDVCLFSFSGERKDIARAFFEKLLQCDVLPEAAVVRIFCEFFSAEEFGNVKSVNNKKRKMIEEKILPVTRALEYITNHYTEKLSVEDVAHSVAMSRTTFFTCFKKYTGVSFSNYILLLRVELCEALLGCTDLSVAAVSDLCGFSNHSHMIKAYKKYKGVKYETNFADVRASHKEYYDRHPDKKVAVRAAAFK